jgi:hypothetical protein
MLHSGAAVLASASLFGTLEDQAVASPAAPDAGGQAPVEVVVRLRLTGADGSDVVAPMVRLSLRDRRSGDRVLPARYFENYLWLLPGQQRTVTISCPQGERQPGNLEITAQGYGTSAVSDRVGR